MNIDLKTVILVNKLYGEEKTREEIMSITGLSAFQVQSCLIKNIPKDKIDVSMEELSNFDANIFINKTWKELCILTDEEVVAIKKFMEEEYE